MGGSFVKGVDCPVKIGGSKNKGSFFVKGADWKMGEVKNGEVLM